jgi:hypothetical protein
MSNLSDHPRLQFTAHVEQPPLRESDIDELQTRVRELAASRTWTLDAPEVVVEPPAIPQGAPLVGCVLEVYSALPPWKDRLPRDVDLRQYHEVAALVEVLSAFSRAKGCVIPCYLGETYVGEIRLGQPDRLLSVGLLGEWRRVLRGDESALE